MAMREAVCGWGSITSGWYHWVGSGVLVGVEPREKAPIPGTLPTTVTAISLAAISLSFQNTYSNPREVAAVRPKFIHGKSVLLVEDSIGCI